MTAIVLRIVSDCMGGMAIDGRMQQRSMLPVDNVARTIYGADIALIATGHVN